MFLAAILQDAILFTNIWIRDYIFSNFISIQFAANGINRSFPLIMLKNLFLEDGMRFWDRSRHKMVDYWRSSDGQKVRSRERVGPGF